MIRRFAFKYSESSYGHWLPLMLADRVNKVEGVLDDLSTATSPMSSRNGAGMRSGNTTGTTWCGGLSSGRSSSPPPWD